MNTELLQFLLRRLGNTEIFLSQLTIFLFNSVQEANLHRRRKWTRIRGVISRLRWTLSRTGKECHVDVIELSFCSNRFTLYGIYDPLPYFIIIGADPLCL